MPNRSFRGSREAFGLGKFILVVGSMGPLFALWGIKGATAIPDLYLIPACTLMIVLPLVFLWWRFRAAKRNNDTRQLVVDRVEGYGHHILTYIIAMLLPYLPPGYRHLERCVGNRRGIAFCGDHFLEFEPPLHQHCFCPWGLSDILDTPPRRWKPL